MGFMTGKDIYENFTNGAGQDGLSGGAAIVNEVAAGYGERAEAIRRLTEKLESVWQGEASGAAQRGAGPLATEHELAGLDLATAQDLTNRQAGSFADARNAVVPVPPEPTAPDPWAVFTSPGEVASYRQQVADYNAANQHNVDVMTGYANASSYNSTGMPQSYGALTDDQAGIAVDTVSRQEMRTAVGGRQLTETGAGIRRASAAVRRVRQLVALPTTGNGELYAAVRDGVGRYRVSEPVRYADTRYGRYLTLTTRRGQVLVAPASRADLAARLKELRRP